MSNEFPLYPTLTEAGEKEAQAVLDRFKESMKKVADEAIAELYCDALNYIESSAWMNFRNEIMDGFSNYDNRKIQSEYDFKRIRQSILANHREDIIDDLNQDMAEEIESLNKHIVFLQSMGR